MVSLFVNHLTTLDFSYLCPKRGVVGETWIVDATLTGDLNEQGMVFDFGHVKKQIKSSLDFLADHRLLVPTTNQAIDYSTDKDRITVTLNSNASGFIQCKAPALALLMVNAEAITPEAMTTILETTLLEELPDNVSGITLTLYPETIPGAFYHYSHGLKKHLGDCQRIAHGHRSAINIAVNGQRSEALEQAWAEQWEDIYIATAEDRLSSSRINGMNTHTFGYTSEQGYFELTVPTEHCYIIHTDSTVELLAEHIVQQLAEQHPGKTIKVTAYEGFNKGAIAEACL